MILGRSEERETEEKRDDKGLYIIAGTALAQNKSGLRDAVQCYLPRTYGTGHFYSLPSHSGLEPFSYDSLP